MTVLKRTSNQTKRKRDDNALRLEMFEFAMKCTMLAANKNPKNAIWECSGWQTYSRNSRYNERILWKI